MQKAAQIMARAACLNAMVSGMNAENAQRVASGDSPAFVLDDFEREIVAAQCGINDVHQLLYVDF
jgi:hypothetical protein